MNCNVTLTAEEFKTIHNTLWAMQYNGMDSESGAEKIRGALAGAYAQENDMFDGKSEHYEKVAFAFGLKTQWSIYEVSNLYTHHPYVGATTILYKNHWGTEPVKATINGDTWADLYCAADACILDSGDDHHVFIESLEPAEDDPHTLILSTGS